VELRAEFEKTVYNTVPNLAKAEEETHASQVWSSGNTLYAKTVAPNEILSVYTPDGILQRQYRLPSEGISAFKLRQGIYIVTVGKSSAKKIGIE